MSNVDVNGYCQHRRPSGMCASCAPPPDPWLALAERAVVAFEKLVEVVAKAAEKPTKSRMS